MAGKKLVIIGGVAAGATAAARARRFCEEAEIVVLERGPFVSFANCGLPYHIGGEIAVRDRLLLQTPDGLRARYNLDVRVRQEVLSIDPAAHQVVVRDLEAGSTSRESYDKLLIATGAAPVRPPLPGIDHPRILSLRNVPDTDAIKQVVDDGAGNAIVVGGGFIGLEMAENLRRRGLGVHLVEMLDQVMPPLDREMAAAIHQTLVANGVKLHLGQGVASFADADGRVMVNIKDGGSLTADLVILAIGVRPESGLAKAAGLAVGERGGIKVNDHMQTSDPDIYAAGDAVMVKDAVTGGEALIPLAGPANRQGRIAADNIFGRASAYRGTQGTSILRVFDLTVGQTGASEKALRRAGLPYDKVYIHPAHHVGYFPGAAAMHVKLLFSKPDGRVLGAEVTGGDGVDKRIDVFAMAIQSRMTVYDLEEAELAYAPQFGSAKDPVNFAGFVAANVLRGDVKNVHADELDAHPGALLLDVRTKAEHEAGAIAGSVLIPLDELRDRHGELRTGRRVLVYCAAGLRGYVAARMLSELGYDAWNLSGGFKTYRAYHHSVTPVSEVQSGGSGSGGTRPGENAPGSCPPSGGVCGVGGGASSCGETAADTATEKPATWDGSSARTLDVRGMQCPGPIVEISRAIEQLGAGEVLTVLATDPGFVADAPAWCRRTGNALLDVRAEGDHTVAAIRKPGDAAARSAAQKPAAAGRDKTIVVFSADLDRAMAAFIIANGAASMGRRVTMFFTFWGLNILRRPDGGAASKPWMERLLGRMMPRGPEKLSLSRMSIGGLGTAMMKRVMRQKQVATLSELMAMARQGGVRFVACAMSMDVMGIRPQELINGVEAGGVGAYLDSAESANVNLFV